MPIIQIDMIEGRTVEQKRDLVKKVTQAVCDAIDAKPERVKIKLVDMARENYAVAGELMLDQK